MNWTYSPLLAGGAQLQAAAPAQGRFSVVVFLCLTLLMGGV